MWVIKLALFVLQLSHAAKMPRGFEMVFRFVPIGSDLNQFFSI
jgi:hypothetical protein